MIYRLNDEFTKIEEMEGLLQNRSDDVEIEFVVCKENPQKDSGAILAPAEKYTFSVKEGENVYARSNKMTGALANLAVLNFKKPASGEAGAGLTSEVIFSGIVEKGKSYTLSKSINDFKYYNVSLGGCGGLFFPVTIKKWFSSDRDMNNNYEYCVYAHINDKTLEIETATFHGWAPKTIIIYGLK